MRTREILGWHFDVRDLLELALLALGGAALIIADKACGRIEAMVDARASKRWAS